MRKLVFLFTFYMGISSTFANQPEYEIMEEIKTISNWDKILWKPLFDSTHSYNAISYKLNLKIFPDQERFDGVNKITGVVCENPLMTADLHCVELDIDSVKHGNVHNGFVIDDSMLHVFLGQIYMPGDTFSFDVYYRGGGNQRGFYFYDSCIYTMSEPHDARYWIPCFDEPWDKVVFETMVNVPIGCKAVSNGIPAGIAVHPEDSTITYRYIENHPIATYLMAITAAEYLHWTIYVPAGYNDSIPVHYYVYPEDSSTADFEFEHVPAMFGFFIEKFGDYPFDKYGMVTASQFRYGGMEHQSISTIHRNWIRGDRRLEKGIAHELAHQWWGDYVTLSDFRHIWLNEGFASYSEILWQKDFYGEEKYRERLMDIAGKFFYEYDGGFQYPIYDPPYVFGGAVYWKGAYILKMLKSYVGEDIFFRILQAYASEFAYGNASTSDFRNICERESGINLFRFFEQWVYSQGYPIFSYQWDARPSPEGYELSIYVNQHQEETDYETFLDFKAYYADIEFPFRLFMIERNQNFIKVIPFNPDSIIFNPDLTLLCKELPATSVEDIPGLPRTISLYANYPNPFNISTIIPYALPGMGRMDIFDINGRLVDSFRVNGFGSLTWNGRNSRGLPVSSGVYIYQLMAGDVVSKKKMTLLK